MFTIQQTTRQFVAHCVIPGYCKFPEKLPQYFEVYLKIFTAFEIVCVFIPQFLVEPLLMYCGILIRKQSCGVLTMYIPCLMFISPLVDQQLSNLCISDACLCLSGHIFSTALTRFCVH